MNFQQNPPKAGEDLSLLGKKCASVFRGGKPLRLKSRLLRLLWSFAFWGLLGSASLEARDLEAKPGEAQASAQTAEASRLSALEARLEELETLIETLEKRQASDRLQITGELRILHHRFDFRNEKSSLLNLPATHEKVVANQWRLRLNLRSELRHNLRFTGRLSTLKNWGDNTATKAPDPSNELVPSDSSLKVERAYFDYFVGKSWSISLGRLPSSEGPPLEWKDWGTRKSTYPAASYNVALDGLGLSWMVFNRQMWEVSWRETIGQIAQYEADSLFRKSETPVNNVANHQLEWSGFGEHWEVQLFLNAANADDIFFWPSAVSNLERALERTTGMPLEVRGASQSLGRVSMRGGHLQAEWKPWQWRIYFTQVQSEFRSNQKRIVFASETGQPLFCFGGYQPLLCEVPTEPRRVKGMARNFGMQWRLPWGGRYAPAWGAEVHHATDFYFASSTGGELGPLGGEWAFENILGNATQLYWLQPLEEHLFVRLSTSWAHQAVQARFFPNDLRQEFRHTSLVLNARF